MEILTLQDIQRELRVGRGLAERYARESGAVLPRTKKGKYLIAKERFEAWMKGDRK